MDLNGDSNTDKSMAYTPKYPVQTLSKSIDVITYMKNNSSAKGISINELSESLKMGKSNVHRILDTLLAYDYVEKVDGSTYYRLGWGLFDAGNMVPSQHTLNSANYVPILEELCDKFKETINLGVFSNNQVVIICKIEPNVRIRANVQVGGREPIHATSIGKLYISSLKDKDIAEYFETANIEKFTDKTIVSYEKMIEEAKSIRSKGYSEDNEELVKGLVCIAVPIRNHTGKVFAGISVSGLAERMTIDKCHDIIKDLESSSKILSEFMGYSTRINI